MNVSCLAVTLPSLCLDDTNIARGVFLAPAASVTLPPLLFFPLSCSRAQTAPGVLLCILV